MLGRNIGLTVSCALGASAFLLPPSTAIGVNHKDAALPFVAIDPKNQILELPCSSCAFPVKSDQIESEDGDKLFFTQGGANNLLLNFTISEDGQALLLNDEQLFPLDFAIVDILGLDWYVKQIPAATTREQIESGAAQSTPLRITGHLYNTGPFETLTPDGDGIISIRWQLLALEHQPMTVDEVLIQLLRTAEGELLILSADPIPTPKTMSFGRPSFMPIDAPKHQLGKECKYLPGPLCNMFSGMKAGRPGCGGAKKFDSFDGRLPTHIRPQFGPPSDDKSAFHGRPHDGHHRHHHHHHRHSIFHTISRGLLAIFLPVIAGVAVGMAVSVLGLLTGHFVGWLWFTVIRGGKRGYSRVASTDIVITVTDMDKKEASLEQFEALPQYEEAPAYVETEKEVL